MATETLTVDFSKAFPLFPLPGVVLLPHGVAPLHIFEDRYRAMTRRALDGAGLIAMASLLPEKASPPAAGEEPAGDAQEDAPPKLRPAVCLGYVSQHERLEDGRYHMLLQGIARAEIVDELDPHEDGFRRARLRPLGEPGAGAEAVAAAADALLKRRPELDALLEDEELQKLAPVARLSEWLEDTLPTEAVCDVVAMTLVQDDALRYALLAEGEAPRRLDAVLRFLQKTRAEMRSADDAPRDAGGYLLN